ncbi:MAG: hypothetical protein J2P36_20550 [Ktedonobacteraceae bacterium]|nr:hypothetical protein [Ktedonobacteraceae bacterium]
MQPERVSEVQTPEHPQDLISPDLVRQIVQERDQQNAPPTGPEPHEQALSPSAMRPEQTAAAHHEDMSLPGNDMASVDPVKKRYAWSMDLSADSGITTGGQEAFINKQMGQLDREWADWQKRGVEPAHAQGVGWHPETLPAGPTHENIASPAVPDDHTRSSDQPDHPAQPAAQQHTEGAQPVVPSPTEEPHERVPASTHADSPAQHAESSTEQQLHELREQQIEQKVLQEEEEDLGAAARRMAFLLMVETLAREERSPYQSHVDEAARLRQERMEEELAIRAQVYEGARLQNELRIENLGFADQNSRVETVVEQQQSLVNNVIELQEARQVDDQTTAARGDQERKGLEHYISELFTRAEMREWAELFRRLDERQERHEQKAELGSQEERDRHTHHTVP